MALNSHTGMAVFPHRHASKMASCTNTYCSCNVSTKRQSHVGKQNRQTSGSGVLLNLPLVLDLTEQHISLELEGSVNVMIEPQNLLQHEVNFQLWRLGWTIFTSFNLLTNMKAPHLYQGSYFAPITHFGQRCCEVAAVVCCFQSEVLTGYRGCGQMSQSRTCYISVLFKSLLALHVSTVDELCLCMKLHQHLHFQHQLERQWGGSWGELQCCLAVFLDQLRSLCSNHRAHW